MSGNITAVKAESSTEADGRMQIPNATRELIPEYAPVETIGANVGNRKYTNFRVGTSAIKRRFLKNVSTLQHQQPSIYEKLKSIAGPTYDITSLNITEKTFSGRNRLYIGNIPTGADENELAQLFQNYGETDDVYINRERNFGFVKMDYHYNAERAKLELHGSVFKGKILKVRFSCNTSSIKLKNLDEHVTNELLQLAFSVFGEVDRSVVILNGRGKSTRTGLVEFSKKSSAKFALRKCNENCFFLTSSLRPVIAEPYEAFDDTDGLTERFLTRKNRDYYTSRSVGPRFAAKNSFEQEYGMRWKHLHEMHKQKLEEVKRENEVEEERLLAQMELARFEHETAMLREQLQAREVDVDRHKREWDLNQQRIEEDERKAEEHTIRNQESIVFQEEELMRRQDDMALYLKAKQLDSTVGWQEAMFKEEAYTLMPTVYYHHAREQHGESSYNNWGNEAKRRRY